MKKRTIIRITSYLLALAVILLGVVVQCYREINFYKGQVRFAYSSALSELNSSMENIRISLEKAAYANGVKQMNNIAVTVYAEAKIAKNAFAKISTMSLDGEKFNKFLSQVGNYAVYVSKTIGNGGEVSDEQRENILKLGQISENIAKDISDIEAQYNEDGFWDKQLTNSINDMLDNVQSTNLFSEIDENFTDYPTLIYDGPYSDYVIPGEPEMLKNADDIDIETGKTIVANLLGVESSQLKFDGSEAGKIETYRFVYSGGVGAVSVKGGYPVYFRKYTEYEKSQYTYEQAIGIAKKYLTDTAKERFKVTYYYADNGICTVNFAYLNGTTVCYTDLVKIGVDLSSGEVVLYEGRGYITNHKVRTLPYPKYTVDEARAVISSSLQINNELLCVIPTSFGEEIQCYEFSCTGIDNKEILVYINAATLEEEEILMVFKTNGGTLVK